jgi:hypothetical protein
MHLTKEEVMYMMTNQIKIYKEELNKSPYSPLEQPIGF